MQMVYQRYISGNVFRKHSAAQLPQATLSKNDMTKKDYRNVQTRLIPASTPLHLLTTFNCTLLKKRSRDQPHLRWHPSVVSLSTTSIAFHPARSAPPTYLNQAPQVTLCLLLHTTTAGHKPIPPSNQSWQQRDGSYRRGALGIKKENNKKVGWPYPWHLYSNLRILLQHSSNKFKSTLATKHSRSLV